jgi:hypothetical protein
LGNLVSSTNKTDHHDIAKILLKVALNTNVFSKVESFLRKLIIVGFVRRLTRRVPNMEQELLTFSEHMISTRIFVGVFGP